MLNIIMNFDISVRLISKRSIIICHDMKHIIKKKKKIKLMEKLGHTHNKKK